MNISLPEEANKPIEQVDLSSATPIDFSRIANPAIRRLAERVARQRQEEVAGAARDGSFVEEEVRIFAKGI